MGDNILNNNKNNNMTKMKYINLYIDKVKNLTLFLSIKLNNEFLTFFNVRRFFIDKTFLFKNII